MMRRPSLLTLIAALIVFSVVLSGIFAAWLAPYNPFQPDMAHRMELPNALHWLGTDALGRDVLSRLLFGSRYTILLALLSTAVALLLGTLAGLLAGYYGGVVDAFLTAAANIFQGIPSACFMVAVAGFWGPGLDSLLVALVVTSWAGFSRIVRLEVLRLRQMAFVEGLRVLGCSDARILLLHIVPNLFSSLLVLAALRLGRGILAIAGLSFLGLGVQPPVPDWSVMVSDAMLYYRSAPHLVLIPGVCILLLVASINILASELRNRLDVRWDEVRR
ncbi:ABC transporter permease [uncultured Selenomonas sp.]|uniref:ABC transporter permease n=1 Tax=uncultured Selenomonas sp. TaxID=159275 RepID=UPI0028E85DDC|nr:ABC transporter permease [uncultured Selenomonas sp.]